MRAVLSKIRQLVGETWVYFAAIIAIYLWIFITWALGTTKAISADAWSQLHHATFHNYLPLAFFAIGMVLGFTRYKDWKLPVTLAVFGVMVSFLAALIFGFSGAAGPDVSTSLTNAFTAFTGYTVGFIIICSIAILGGNFAYWALGYNRRRVAATERRAQARAERRAERRGSKKKEREAKRQAKLAAQNQEDSNA